MTWLILCWVLFFSRSELTSGDNPVAQVVEPEKETAFVTDLPMLVARDALVTAQKSDPSIAKCWAGAVPKSKCNEKQPFFVQNEVLMRRWVSASCKIRQLHEKLTVYQVVLVPIANKCWR